MHAFWLQITPAMDRHSPHESRGAGRRLKHPILSLNRLATLCSARGFQGAPKSMVLSTHAAVLRSQELRRRVPDAECERWNGCDVRFDRRRLFFDRPRPACPHMLQRAARGERRRSGVSRPFGTILDATDISVASCVRWVHRLLREIV